MTLETWLVFKRILLSYEENARCTSNSAPRSASYCRKCATASKTIYSFLYKENKLITQNIKRTSPQNTLKHENKSIHNVFTHSGSHTLPTKIEIAPDIVYKNLSTIPISDALIKKHAGRNIWGRCVISLGLIWYLSVQMRVWAWFTHIGEMHGISECGGEEGWGSAVAGEYGAVWAETRLALVQDCIDGSPSVSYVKNCCGFLLHADFITSVSVC